MYAYSLNLEFEKESHKNSTAQQNAKLLVVNHQSRNEFLLLRKFHCVCLKFCPFFAALMNWHPIDDGSTRVIYG